MDILQPLMPWFLLIIGLYFGSFANVVIYRLPIMMGIVESTDGRGINLWWPPSHCPHCKAGVKPWDNIPVVSWLLLRGKCRQCAQPIAVIYPLSEALVGFAWFALAWFFPDAKDIYLLTGLCSLFTVFYILAVIDCKFLLLPDSLVFMALWGGLLLAASGKTTVSIQSAIFGVALTWLLLWGVMYTWLRLRNYHGLGQGDVKLYAACSAWLGWESLPVLLLASATLGGLFWLIVRFVDNNNESDDTDATPFYIPFGPSIAVSAFLMIFITEYW